MVGNSTLSNKEIWRVLCECFQRTLWELTDSWLSMETLQMVTLYNLPLSIRDQLLECDDPSTILVPETQLSNNTTLEGWQDVCCAFATSFWQLMDQEIDLDTLLIVSLINLPLNAKAVLLRVLKSCAQYDVEEKETMAFRVHSQANQEVVREVTNIKGHKYFYRDIKNGIVYTMLPDETIVAIGILPTSFRLQDLRPLTSQEKIACDQEGVPGIVLHPSDLSAALKDSVPFTEKSQLYLQRYREQLGFVNAVNTKTFEDATENEQVLELAGAAVTHNEEDAGEESKSQSSSNDEEDDDQERMTED